MSQHLNSKETGNPVRTKTEPCVVHENIHAHPKESLHMSQMTYQARAYPSFSSRKRLGVFLLHPGWDATPSPHQGK